jgi:hypothetical protein
MRMILIGQALLLHRNPACGLAHRSGMPVAAASKLAETRRRVGAGT